MSDTVELVVLRNLLEKDDYCRRVLPYIRGEYFSSKETQIVFDEISTFVNDYSKPPTVSAIKVSIEKRNDLSEQQFKAVHDILDGFKPNNKEDVDWLIKTTEKFCQDRALYNAVRESIKILDGKSKNLPSAMPELLQEALSVSFNTNIGHDYFENADDRFEFYHEDLERIPFDLDYMNRITKGGTPRKTLNIVMAGTGVGKSLFLCHHAAACISAGFNVLYITLEMAEERIAERIDANLFNMNIDQVGLLSKQMFKNKVASLQKKCAGRLIIKEYPTASANVNHFRILLKELRLKRNFKPDLIIVDYLNICCSARIKGEANSYTIVKSIAEELRGLAVEHDVPVWSATQVNRGGFNNSDMGLENTSESFGLPATADFMIALISGDELEERGQLMFKQLKNRYSDIGKPRKFLVGLDKPKMKFYDLDESAQADLIDNKIRAGLDDEDEEDDGSTTGFRGRGRFRGTAPGEEWTV